MIIVDALRPGKARLACALYLATAFAVFAVSTSLADDDPLPSWNEGASKAEILAFVAAASDPNNANFVPLPDRIAVFDNDGTLWAEKPIYFQVYFVIDRIKRLAPDNPDWQTTQPYQAVLEDDHERMAAFTRDDLMTLIIASHSDISETDFADAAEDFLASAKHPQFDVPFTDLTYQPMLELLDLLRDHQFRIFIVSGGGVAFIRAFAEEAYDINRENVIGSSLQYEFRESADGSDIHRLPAVNSLDDKEVKPANIMLHIGRRPVIAVGNSDGDLQMLQYTDDGSGPSLMVLVHHDDAEREFDYDHGTEAALEMAEARGWVVVSIARDFGTVFSFQDR